MHPVRNLELCLSVYWVLEVVEVDFTTYGSDGAGGVDRERVDSRLKVLSFGGSDTLHGVAFTASFVYFNKGFKCRVIDCSLTTRNVNQGSVVTGEKRESSHGKMYKIRERMKRTSLMG